jgi:hypothetical protein
LVEAHRPDAAKEEGGGYVRPRVVQVPFDDVAVLGGGQQIVLLLERDLIGDNE